MVENLIGKLVRFLVSNYGLGPVLRGVAAWLKEDVHRVALGRSLLSDTNHMLHANMRAMRAISELEHHASSADAQAYQDRTQEELMGGDDMPEFYITCVMVTNHVSWADEEYLMRWKVNDYHCGIWCAQFQYGHVLSIFDKSKVGESNLDSVEWRAAHPSLATIADWAIENGVRYIVLDRDADAVKGLPVYDW